MSLEADYLGAFEEHSPEGIREALAAGASPTRLIKGKTPIDCLIEGYLRSPRFAACLRVLIECARPTMDRLEASRQGPKKCGFCGAVAFNLVPGAMNPIYACCGCRAEYAHIFFELCTAQRPDLAQRSQGDIFFFERCFDSEVEAWAHIAAEEAIQKLRGWRQQHG